jgi:multisubunit Na+/H+ antiporter MnhF subunit
MNLWLAGALGLLVALLPCAWVCVRSGRADRLVALQLATLCSVLLLVLLAEGLERPSYDDLALTLVVLAFPGTLAFAISLERWL